MIDITKTTAALEAARQLVTALAPHLKTLAVQARPLVAPVPARSLFGPALGVFGAGIAVGAGIALMSQTELRARAERWVRRRASDARAVRDMLRERGEGEAGRAPSGAKGLATN